MQQILKTNTATYLLDTENPKLILKASGKFSRVYIAYQLPEKLPVVLKILNDEIAQQPNGLKNFIKEATFSIHHGNIQKTLDYFTDGVTHYLIKEYISGETLRQTLKSKIKYDWKFYTRCAIHLLPVLKTLHDKGIYHCDLRPDNILIVHNQNNLIEINNPEVYLLDLGLAKTDSENDTNIKSPFALIYSPPEQLLNYYELINTTSDLYSLGITLYECITGTKPFMDGNPELVMHLQLNSFIDSNKKIPLQLFEVLKKATTKHKFNLPVNQLDDDELKANLIAGQKERFQSAFDFRNALIKVLIDIEEVEEKNKSKNWWNRLFSKIDCLLL